MGIETAIIGSALIGGASSLYAGSQAKKASNKALDAQTQANDKALALQRETRDMALNLQSPFIQGGYAGWDALLKELGVQPQGQSPAPAPAATGGQPGGIPGLVSEPGSKALYTARANNTPQPDGAAYLQANPDVQAEFQRNMASGKGREYLASLGADTPEGFAKYHYDTFGKGEGRQLPMTQPQTLPAPGPTPGDTAVPTTPTDPQPGRDLMSAQRPAGTPPPTFTRPNAVDGPGAFSFDASKIAEDPGYQFRLAEGLKGVNAASAVRGKLRSGDAAMALQARGEGLASQETQNAFQRQLAGWQANTGLYQYQQGRQDNIFGDDRAYGTGLWQYQSEDADRDFETDRGYQTSRYDTNIGNLFNLAGMGQGAAGAVTGAQSNYANNASNIFGSQANAAADAAYQKGAANASMVGGIAGAASNLFANWGGGAARAPASTAGSVNYGSSLNNPFGRSYTF